MMGPANFTLLFNPWAVVLDFWDAFRSGQVPPRSGPQPGINASTRNGTEDTLFEGTGSVLSDVTAAVLIVMPVTSGLMATSTWISSMLPLGSDGYWTRMVEVVKVTTPDPVVLASRHSRFDGRG